MGSTCWIGLYFGLFAVIYVTAQSDKSDCQRIINLSGANITIDWSKVLTENLKASDINDITSIRNTNGKCFSPKSDFFVQIDFNRLVTINRLKFALQDSKNAINSCKLEFSLNNKTWFTYRHDNLPYLILIPQKEGENIIKVNLEQAVSAYHVRFLLNPKKPNQKPLRCLRFELHGCDEAVLPDVKAQPIVTSNLTQHVNLSCHGDGMVGMSILWKNFSHTIKSIGVNDPTQKFLKVGVESNLPLTIGWQDVPLWKCVESTTYAECVKNFTCVSYYSFNSNNTVEATSKLNIKMYYPEPPTDFSVRKKMKSVVIIGWNAPSLNSFNDGMLQYVLSCNHTGSFTNETLPMTVRTKRLDGLALYSPYQCKLMITLNDDWKKRISYVITQTIRVLNFKSFSLKPDVTPILTATVLSPTSIRVQFEVMFNKTEYGRMAGFHVFASMLSYTGVKRLETLKIPEDQQTINKTIFGSELRSYVLTNVKPWSKYKITLKVFNEDNLYSRASTARLKTPEGAPITGPDLFDRHLQIERVIFEIVYGDESFKNGAITQYTILRNPGNKTITRDATKNMITYDNLEPFTKYHFSCKASTKYGYGPYGKINTIITPEDLPNMPENVRVVNKPDSTTLMLSWNSPTRPNGNISLYEVHVTLLNQSDIYLNATPQQIHLFNVSVLKHDVGTVSVRARTGAGWGRWSNIIVSKAKQTEANTNKSLNDVVLIVAFTAAVFFLLILIVLCFVHHKRFLRKRRPDMLLVDPSTQPIFPRISSTDGPDDDDDYGIELADWATPRRISDSIGTGSQSIINNARDPIPAEEFADYMNEAKTNSDCEMLIEQFESLPNGKCSPWQVAELPENRPKNRYANVAAYDHSRVILRADTETRRKQSDYINASCVHGYNHEEKEFVKYISTQGPTENTQDDFWRLIWQEEITIIVMLTNLRENDKIKCSQYWPHERTKAYGNLNVTLDKIDKTADYDTRTFQVELPATKEVRTVRQFHFVSWPDHGVPDYPTAILSLRRRVRHYYDENKPMLIHCSAGIGRSGCFILIDAMLERIDKERSVDVFNYLKYMRSRRINMVQNVGQYRFAHLAILEYITFGNTEIFVGELDKKIRELGKNNGMADEFALLTRNTTETSGNMFQVLLREGRYIEAYHVDGYKQQNAFILTKACTEESVADFWKMVLEKQCHTIVMLNKCQETQHEYFKYWPDVDNHSVYRDTTVLTVSEVANGNIITRKIKVTTNKRRCEVHHFQYVDWPDLDVPNRRGYTNICTLMQAVEKSQQNLGNGPIIVHAGNGFGRSGSFIAIYNSTERLKVEQLIDVLQCVRAIRIAQPLAIANITQYQFVYNMLRTYLEGFENYWNYKDYKVTRSPLGSTSTN